MKMQAPSPLAQGMHFLLNMVFQRAPSLLRRTSVPLQALALGAALVLAPGCQPEWESPEADALGQTARSLRVANSLTTHALVLNAISTNSSASALLIGGGLVPLFDPVTGSSYLEQQLKDPEAQQFMSYLVGCALPKGTSVTWKNPLTSTVSTWDGILGLCPAWKTGAPSETCKNWVSACLLARNNAYGRHVELSLRGEDPTRPTFFATETETRPVEFDPDLGGPVPSFSACGTPMTSVGRDCGWKVDYVGQCTPGQTVRLGAGGKAPDECTTGATLGSASGTRMMLRVCEDLVGCDHSSAHLLGQSEGACSSTAPAVSFTCPVSGYFNVMAAPYTSTLSGGVSVAVETGTPAAARYRLSEKDVFRMREGAYYGNLLDPDALALQVYVDERGQVQGKEQTVKGSVYRRMYSCQAPEWTSEAAYASYRVCALPDSGANCAATPTGSCIDPSDRTYPASKCHKEDGTLVPGDGDFEECSDTLGTVWKQPITVYLHEPCALMPDEGEDSCAWRGGGNPPK